jgi:glycosyltransferase involved in cell wall biosynthesis
VIITEIISPYRTPLFNALAKNPNVDLQVIFLAETDPQLRQWQVEKKEIGFPYQVLPSLRQRMGGYNVLLNRGMAGALSKLKPDVVMCGGYNYVASWQALRWARQNKIPFVLWSESNLQDARGGRAPVEFLKDSFLHRCSGFVVPGRSAWEYLLARGVPESSIFTAVNAVDNRAFANAAAAVRRQSRLERSELKLPDRYFLFVGRLVKEKGVFELLHAYATLEEDIRKRFGLVFVGDGASRSELERKARSVSSGELRFAGFVQQNSLAAYYALAKVLVLPTYTDTWGLVVNEGMACGLPVIVSKAAGCAVDLVSEDWNGKIVPPRDASSLHSAMQFLASHPAMIEDMRVNSRTRIAEFSPAQWAEGAARMVAAVERKN